MIKVTRDRIRSQSTVSICLFLLFFSTPKTALAEEMKVVKIYQGDAGKFVSASGRPMIFHLAGCTAPSPKDPFGTESLASLSRLINQKKVDVIIIRKETELALVRRKVGQKDPCLDQLRSASPAGKASGAERLEEKTWQPIKEKVQGGRSSWERLRSPISFVHHGAT